MRDYNKINPCIVDLSHWQAVGSFDAAVKEGLQAVILKVTQGTSYVDDNYKGFRQAAIDANILFGAYHFADGNDAAGQVDHFLRNIGDDLDDLLIALDYEAEPHGRTMDIDPAAEWMRLIQEKTGQFPKVYSGNLIKERLDGKDSFWGQHDLWLAQYSTHFVLPPSWDVYWAWQFTGDGVGPSPHGFTGIGDGIDVSSYAGTPDELIQEWVRTTANPTS